MGLRPVQVERSSTGVIPLGCPAGYRTGGTPAPTLILAAALASRAAATFLMSAISDGVAVLVIANQFFAMFPNLIVSRRVFATDGEQFLEPVLPVTGVHGLVRPVEVHVMLADNVSICVKKLGASGLVLDIFGFKKVQHTQAINGILARRALVNVSPERNLRRIEIPRPSAARSPCGSGEIRRMSSALRCESIPTATRLQRHSTSPRRLQSAQTSFTWLIADLSCNCRPSPYG